MVCVKPGDIVTADSGARFVIHEPIAYQGDDDCTNMTCSRRDGKCVGYHCPTCGAPCSMMGHKCPERDEA